MTPTGIYAPGSGGKGTGLHPVDTRDANNQNLSRESLIRYKPNPPTPPVTDQLEAHYAARLESFSDGDAVGTLTDQQNANDLTQATSSKKPTYRDNATDNIGGRPVIDFDGSDDSLSGPFFYDSTTGTVILVYVWETLSGNQSVLSATDTTESDVPWWKLGPSKSGNITPDQRETRNTITFDDQSTKDIVVSDTDMTAGTEYIVVYQSDGTDYDIIRNDTFLSLTAAFNDNSGHWTGDLPANPNIVEMGTFGNFHADIRVAEALLYNDELTSSEIDEVENWLNNTVGYGIF